MNVRNGVFGVLSVIALRFVEVERSPGLDVACSEWLESLGARELHLKLVLATLK